MIQLLTDSAADLTAQELQALQITVIPLGVHFGADAYLDGRRWIAPHFTVCCRAALFFPPPHSPLPRILNPVSPLRGQRGTMW